MQGSNPPIHIRNREYIALFFGYFVCALLPTTLGMVFLKTQQEYVVSLLHISMLEVIKDVFVILTTFVLSLCIHRYPLKTVVLFSLAATALGTVVGFLNLGFFSYLVTYACVGMGIGSIMMALYLFGGIIAKQNAGYVSYFNLLECCYMIAAIIGPLVFAAMMTKYVWNDYYLVVFLLSAIAFVWIFFTKTPVVKSVKNDKSLKNDLSNYRMFSQKTVIIFLLIIIFYIGLEVILFNWLPLYNKIMFNVSGKTSGYLLAYMSTLFIGSRIVVAAISKKIKKWGMPLGVLMLLTFVFLGGGLIINSVANGDIKGHMILIFLLPTTGLFLGPFFPSLASSMINSFEIFSHRIIIFYLVAIMTIASSAGTLLIATISHFITIKFAFFLLLFFVFLIYVLTLILRKKQLSYL